MDLFNLVAKLGLDTSEYDNKLGSVMNGIKSFGKTIATGLTIATRAVVTFAGSSVKTGMEFDKAMSQVQATMLKTAEEMENDIGSVDTAYGHFEGNLRDFAKFLGENTAFSATQAAKALNYMALAGYETQDSLNMLPHVMSLASAGSIDLARASDMVTDAQTALGLTFDQTGDMVNQMAMAASKSNTSVEQLGDAILTLGGTARYMYSDLENGIPVTNELTKVLGVMADNGIKGSEAGTHLRNMILKLSAPTKEATAMLEKYAKVLGHDLVFDKKTGEMRRFQDIFQDLNVVMGDMTDEQRLQAFSQLFNTRDIAAANALLNTTGERWDQLGESIDNASGSAADMANIQLDNLSGALTLLKSAFEGLQISVSEKLTPTLVEFVRFGTEAIGTLSTAFQNGRLSGAMAALGQILSQGLTMIVQKLPTFIDAGMQLLGAFGEGILKNLPSILNIGIYTLEKLLEGILEAIPEISDAVHEIIENLTLHIEQSLPVILDIGFEILLAIIDGIVNNLPVLIPMIVTLITTIATKLTSPDMLAKIINAGFQVLEAVVKGVINALPTLVAQVPVILAQFANNFVNFMPMILERGKLLIVNLVNGIGVNLSKVREKVEEIKTTIKNKIQEVIDGALRWGADLIGNFVQGIKNSINKVVNAAKSVANKVKSILGFSEPEEGPLSNFHTYAPDMMKLFAQGIRDNTRLVTAQLEKSFDFGDMLTPYVPVSTAYDPSDSEGLVSRGDITINVYGSEGQNIKELADEVMERLTTQYDRRRAVYA